MKTKLTDKIRKSLIINLIRLNTIGNPVWQSVRVNYKLQFIHNLRLFLIRSRTFKPQLDSIDDHILHYKFFPFSAYIARFIRNRREEKKMYK
jgi:hypothetical protein